jgi:hypothetical protein
MAHHSRTVGPIGLNRTGIHDHVVDLAPRQGKIHHVISMSSVYGPVVRRAGRGQDRLGLGLHALMAVRE